ncbi:MAG: T9SS C-terminal target domain-containing protein [Candidatus Zixiibacteriota bacterium]|nr:MAG: T9SS C-terminal target domain-containing protein [candidate division Zixibacteria bacterium]
MAAGIGYIEGEEICFIRRYDMMRTVILTLACLVAGWAAAAPDHLDPVTLEVDGGRLLAQPDAMGRIHATTEAAGRILQVAGADDFTPFPGWPKTASGNAWEGGICLNLDADPDLEVVYHVGNNVYAWNSDGTNVPGWPQSTANFYQSGAPAAGDIDGDGALEIVVQGIYTMTQGRIYAFELNGTVVPGFPITHGYATRTIVLADLDGDNDMEIVTNKRLYPVGEAWVYQGDGTVYPGWPKPLDSVPSSSAAVGDINNDGNPEVIVESYYQLHVWDANGNPLPGFPFVLTGGATNSYSSPALADLNGDGYREIIFGTHGSSNLVFVLRHDGTLYPGWPQSVNSWIYSTPAVGFIDGDNLLDIAVGDQILSATPMNKIYAWNANGQPLAGFPIEPLNSINSQILLADLDGDGYTELIVDDNTQNAQGQGKYLAFNHDGTPLTGWPLVTQGTTMFNVPSLADVNGNGILDLAGGGSASSQTNVNLWASTYAYLPASIQIPMFQYNLRHDGLVPTAAVIPPEVEIVLAAVGTPQVPPGGGSFDFNATLINNGATPANIDAWIMVQLPNQAWYGPALGPLALELPGGSSITRLRTQNVPATAPAGDYWYVGRVGVYPGVVYDSSGFTFTKTVSGDGGLGAGENWACTGEPFPGQGSQTPLIPSGLALSASPNPFNPTTAVSYELPAASRVSLRIYDTAGREVATLVNGWRDAGAHQASFDASGLPSGIYFAKLEAGGTAQTLKLILLK